MLAVFAGCAASANRRSTAPVCLPPPTHLTRRLPARYLLCARPGRPDHASLTAGLAGVAMCPAQGSSETLDEQEHANTAMPGVGRPVAHCAGVHRPGSEGDRGQAATLAQLCVAPADRPVGARRG